MRPAEPPLVAEWYEVELFGAKRCPTCGETFAANTDYFGPDRSNRDGLTSQCRNCRRKRDRDRGQYR